MSCQGLVTGELGVTGSLLGSSLPSCQASGFHLAPLVSLSQFLGSAGFQAHPVGPSPSPLHHEWEEP